MSSIKIEFLEKLTDEELVAVLHERDDCDEIKEKTERLVWKLCDRYDEEYGSTEQFTMIEDMDDALISEIQRRYILLVSK